MSWREMEFRGMLQALLLLGGLTKLHQLQNNCLKATNMKNRLRNILFKRLWRQEVGLINWNLVLAPACLLCLLSLCYGAKFLAGVFNGMGLYYTLAQREWSWMRKLVWMVLYLYMLFIGISTY